MEPPDTSKGGRDWNEEFQRLMGDFQQDTDKELERMARLKLLSSEFTERATAIGTKIVQELFLPANKKTIKTVTNETGGIAGGEKYLVDGIFFKFAIDNKGIYGTDENAMKSASLEFKSFLELQDCRVQGLHFPFVVILDYRGYRLSAMTKLPIDKSTLVYGSDNGGNSIHADNNEFNRRMKKSAKLLNICSHYVWDARGTKQRKLYAPVDCEGHLGRDGRFYVVDPARLFPPSPPVQGLKGSRLYRLLRPELVKRHRVSLCSDAFSAFFVENREAFDYDVTIVYRDLHARIIPQFALSLSSKSFAKVVPSEEGATAISTIEAEAHQQGINMRYLGRVRLLVSSEDASAIAALILVATLSRTLKNIIRTHMRTLKSASESAYLKLIVTYLNVIFGASQRTDEFWKVLLKDRIRKAFPGTLEPEEDDEPSFDMRSKLDMSVLFDRLVQLLGAVPSPAAMQKLKAVQKQPSSVPFSESEILKIVPLVKQSNRLAFEEATALSKKALSKGEKHASEYFKLAEANFRKALQIKPDDKRSLHNWALALSIQAGRAGPSESKKLFEAAEEKLRQAISLDKTDLRASLLLGNVLLEKSQRIIDPRLKLDYAIGVFEGIATDGGDSFELFYNWGAALLYHATISTHPQSILQSAVDKFRIAAALKPNSYRSVLNLAIALHRLGRVLFEANPADLDKAKRHFLESYSKFESSLSEKQRLNADVLYNWGNALFRHARILEQVDKHDEAYLVCASAAEKYVGALDIHLNFYDAILNWSKLLVLQSSLPAKGMDSETGFAVSYFLAVVEKLYINGTPSMKAQMKLEPILELMQSSNLEVQRRVFRLLNRLCSSDSKTLSIDAAKAVRSLLASPLSRAYIKPHSRLLEDSQLGAAELPTLSSWIVRTIGEGDSFLSSAPTGAVSSSSGSPTNSTLFSRINDFITIADVTQELSAVEKIRLVTRKSDRRKCLMLLMDKSQLMYRLIPEDQDPDVRMTVASDDSNLLAEFIQRMTMPVSFRLPLAESFAVEGDSYAFIFDIGYVPVSIKQVITERCLNEAEIRFYASEILEGLEQLHSCGLLYGPMHARDLVIDRDGHVVLHRLPFSAKVPPKLEDLPYARIPPEVLVGMIGYSQESEWYSFGILLLELALGKNPLEGSSFDETYKNVLTGVQDHNTATLPPDLVALIRQLVALDPQRRLVESERIKANSFLSDLDWSVVRKGLQGPLVVLEPQNYDTLDPASTMVAELKVGKFRGFSFVEP